MSEGVSDETKIELLNKRVSDLEKWRDDHVDPKIEDLALWKRWQIGCAVTVAAIVGFFAGPIKKALGIG